MLLRQLLLKLDPGHEDFIQRRRFFFYDLGPTRVRFSLELFDITVTQGRPFGALTRPRQGASELWDVLLWLGKSKRQPAMFSDDVFQRR